MILRRTNTKNEVCPQLSLAATTNDLEILLSTYSGSEASSSNEASCGVKNIPLQKWVHVLMTTQGRTLDVYIDGISQKMYAWWCSKNGSTAPYNLPEGGFSGFTSKLRYYANQSIQETYEIYRRFQ